AWAAGRVAPGAGTALRRPPRPDGRRGQSAAHSRGDLDTGGGPHRSDPQGGAARRSRGERTPPRPGGAVRRELPQRGSANRPGDRQGPVGGRDGPGGSARAEGEV